LSPKAIPMRRCVGCMTSFPKASLVRIVSRDGCPRIDLSGKANGRGVYLCRSSACMEKLLKKKNAFASLGIAPTGAEKDDFRKQFELLCDPGEVREC